MTLQQAAKAAIDVQDACNLSGVVRTFSEILLDVLWPAARAEGKGTDWVNRHPISQLFADKILSLSGNGLGDMDTYSHAYAECIRLSKGVSDAQHC